MKLKTLLALTMAFTLCITSYPSSYNAGAGHVFAKPQQIYAAPKTAHSYKLAKQRISSFQSIDADLKDSDLKILPSKDQNCYISYSFYCYNPTVPLTYQSKDNTLHLISKAPIQWAYHKIKKGKNTISYSESTITVFVPAKILEKINIESSDGNLTLKNISCKNVSCTTQYGDIFIGITTIRQHLYIKTEDFNVALSKSNIPKSPEISTLYGDISADSLTILGTAKMNTTDGNVLLSRVTADDSLQITTRYGDISTDHTVISGTVRFDTSDGNVSLNSTDISGSLQSTTRYGDVNASLLTISGKTKLKTSGGNISLKLDDKSLRHLNISMTTEYGSLSVPEYAGGSKRRYKEYGHRYDKSSDAGSACLNVITSDGDICLR